MTSNKLPHSESDRIKIIKTMFSDRLGYDALIDYRSIQLRTFGLPKVDYPLFTNEQ